MGQTCTRCEETGFLNADQLPDGMLDGDEMYEALYWISENLDHDVSVCDCCGDGESWYGTPGEHYGRNDPPGHCGPYAYNGGYCECH